MAAPNISPIFTRSGDVSRDGTTGMASQLLTATGDYTGVSANHVLVFTADAANGGFVQKLHFCAEGTNTASVARIYLNNGSAATTATNNSLFGQLALPATTAINTTSTIEPEYFLGFALPLGFRIYVGLGTTVAAGWRCVCIGGKY